MYAELTLGFPLRDRRPVLLQLPAAGGSVATQLTRHGGGVMPDCASDLPHALVLCSEQRDFLALSKGQIAAQGWNFRSNGGMPPALWNHRAPTACATPIARAASSARRPLAIFSQNATSTWR